MDSPVTIPISTLLNPSVLHVEITSRCVLKCPRCPRTELDLDYLNKEISLDLFKKTFSPEDLLRIRYIIFCGHTGDPIYANSLIPIITYIRSCSDTRILIMTNGSYRKEKFWEDLGTLLTANDMVVFGIDGWDQISNNFYRINSDFDSILTGIKTLRRSSPCLIKWSLIYFKFNQNQIKKVEAQARDLGCDFFECVRSSKFDNQYAINGVDNLKPDDDLIASTMLYERNVISLTDRILPISIYTPQKMHTWAKCANHLKEIFLDVRGLILPCAWFTGDYQENPFLKKYHDRLSIHNRPFLEILQDQDLWETLRTSWDRDPMPICRIKCKNAKQ